jgi:hypothetical protein
MSCDLVVKRILFVQRISESRSIITRIVSCKEQERKKEEMMGEQKEMQ